MSRRYVIRELRDVWESFVAADRQYLRSPKLAYAIPALSLLVWMVGLSLMYNWDILLDKGSWKKLLLFHLPCFLMAWAWYLSRSFGVRLCTICALVANEMILGFVAIHWWHRVRGLASDTSFLILVPIAVYIVAALVGFLCAVADHGNVRDRKLE